VVRENEGQQPSAKKQYYTLRMYILDLRFEILDLKPENFAKQNNRVL
jgi:hypothetical protein